jgi:hypothetical protein
MIYTAPYIMPLMRANPLQGHVGEGVGHRNRDFFGPCKMASSRQASAIWGQKMTKQIPQESVYAPAPDFKKI